MSYFIFKSVVNVIELKVNNNKTVVVVIEELQVKEIKH